jgi:flagellar biosynthesis anti-sigma factor FlgM
MKIDPNAPNPNVQPLASRAEESRPRPAAGAGEAGSAAGSDTVELSPQAQLVGRALHEASAGPAVRQDKVDQARQKLAAGEIGQDAARLADKIIDHLLEE